MDITEKIQNAIEWANKRLTLQGQELSQEQKNYLTFALSQNFTNNKQALQLQQTGVSNAFYCLDKECEFKECEKQCNSCKVIDKK